MRREGERIAGTECVLPHFQLPTPTGHRRRQGRRVGPWQTPRPTSAGPGGSSGDSDWSRSPSALSSNDRHSSLKVASCAARSAAIAALIFTFSTARSTISDQRLPLLGIIVRVRACPATAGSPRVRKFLYSSRAGVPPDGAQGLPGDGLIVQVLRWTSATSRSVQRIERLFA